MNPDGNTTIVNIAAGKTRDHCTVMLSNGELLSIHIDIVLKNNLRKGSPLTEELLDSLSKQQRIGEARNKAFNYASGLDKTEYMTIQNLKLKGFTTEEIEPAVHYLKEYGLIDDLQFCRKFIEAALRKKPSGKMNLTAELLKRGVDRQTIQDALDECYPEEDTESLALNAARKKLRLVKGKDIAKQKASIVAFLQRKGFSYPVISKVLSELNLGPDDD